MGKRRRRNGAGFQGRAAERFANWEKPRWNATPVENRNWQPDPRCDQPASLERGQAGDSSGDPQLEEDRAWQQDQAWMQQSILEGLPERSGVLEQVLKAQKEGLDNFYEQLAGTEKQLNAVQAALREKLLEPDAELHLRLLKTVAHGLREAHSKCEFLQEDCKAKEAEMEYFAAECKLESEKVRNSKVALQAANSTVKILQCSVALYQFEKSYLEEAQKCLQKQCEKLQSSLQAEKALRQIEADGFEKSMKEHQQLQTSHERHVRELKKKMAKLLEAKARLVTKSLRKSAEVEELTANCKAECEKGGIREAELQMANSLVVILKGSVALLKAQLEEAERPLQKKCEELESSLETEKALRQTEANGFQRTVKEQEVSRSSQDEKVQGLRREVAKLLEEKGILIFALQRKTAEAGRLQGATGGPAATGSGLQDAKVKEAELKRKAKRADLLEAVNKELVKKLKGMERTVEETDAATEQTNSDRGDKKLALLREELRKEVERNIALKSELKAERTKADQEKDELSKKVEANLCFCVERDFSLAMIPCGHCLCSTCWDMHKDMRKHAGLAFLTCPVCQIDVSETQRVFKPALIDDAAVKVSFR